MAGRIRSSVSEKREQSLKGVFISQGPAGIPGWVRLEMQEEGAEMPEGEEKDGVLGLTHDPLKLSCPAEERSSARAGTVA